MNCVPSTYKSPLTLTIPVLSPIAAGSIIMVDGPVRVAVPLETSDRLTPIPVVSNLFRLSKYSSTAPSWLKTKPVSSLAAFLTSNLLVLSIKDPVPVSLIKLSLPSWTNCKSLPSPKLRTSLSPSLTLPLNVETPDTESCVANIVDWLVVIPVNVERPVIVTLPSTFNDWSKSTILLNVETPVTTNWSSIVTVPPAESIVRLPVDVSISLSLAIPIRTLSISAPPLASTRPMNVDTPETESWVPKIVVWFVTIPTKVDSPVIVTLCESGLVSAQTDLKFSSKISGLK